MALLRASWLGLLTLVFLSAGVGVLEAGSAYHSPLRYDDLRNHIYDQVCEGLKPLKQRFPSHVQLWMCRETPPLPVPTVSHVSNPESITVGSSSLLTWSSANAETCTASGGWSGAQEKNGSLSVSPATTTTYTLTCSNATGSTSDSATVTVNAAPPSQPTLTFGASPTTIVSGNSATLSWTAANANGCTASGNWSGLKTTSGSEGVSPTTTAQYVLTCTGNGGSVSGTTTVTVTPAPTPTLSLTVNPASILVGTSSLISWSSTNTTACTASDGWSGSKDTSGSMVVTPATTTTYTLTCTGAGGSVSESETVTVSPHPMPTVDLTANPTTITRGGTTTLSWASTQATTCTGSGAWSGAVPLNSSIAASPATTSTYTLTCSGLGGEAADSVVVTVLEPAPQVAHVIISEAYYNPDTAHGDDPGNEWVELYNPTASPVDISGWSIMDATSTDAFPATTTIAAGGYLIVTGTSTTANFWSFPGGVPVVVLGGSIGNGLSNSSDGVFLKSGDTVVDAVSWGSNTTAFDPSTASVADGHSIARSSVTTDTNTASDWVDRETPTPGL